jgi:hypothetical protein
MVWGQKGATQGRCALGTGEFQHKPWLALRQGNVSGANALDGRPGCHAACGDLCVTEALCQTGQDAVLEARIMLPWNRHPGAIVQVCL